jgi:16S rRNA (cytosine967-C5)-methyltransferase
VTPAGRLAASIELLAAIDASPRKPADAVANDFFRSRRYIGSGDRRAVADRVWSILRTRQRLSWRLAGAGAAPTSRLLVAASLLLDGWRQDGIAQAFSGGRYAPDPLDRTEKAILAGLEGRTLDGPDMPPQVRLELPEWLMPSLEARFGAALADEMVATLQPAPLDLRVNLLKGSREEAAAALLAEGIDAVPTRLSPWGLRVDGRRFVTGGAAFRSGLLEIQDEGSQLVAALVGAEPGMRVADWCAGAGGKTLALAMTMQNRGQLHACDISAHRMESAVRRLRRAGVHNAVSHLIETGDKWAKRRMGTFDRVLVDAPCTGTGTWRRNPDARHRLAPGDLAELLPKQATILDEAAKLVRRSGRLVYATCSLLPEENEAQVSGFLARHAGFRLYPLTEPGVLPHALAVAGLGKDAFLALTPHTCGTDGFFAAVLERAD